MEKNILEISKHSFKIEHKFQNLVQKGADLEFKDDFSENSHREDKENLFLWCMKLYWPKKFNQNKAKRR